MNHDKHQPRRPSQRFLLRRCAGLWLIWVVPAVVYSQPPATPPQFSIIGYLPEYRLNTFHPEHAGLLTDLILFAAEPTASGEVELGKLRQAPWEKLWKFREQHHTRLLLCLGGWGRSDNFSRAILDEAARTRLVAALTALLRERRLDGLDIDWEYPQTPEEWEGYITLLQQLHKAFQPEGWTLSLTVAPWRELPVEAAAAVDRVQLMSYDYGQRHSTPQQAEKDLQAFQKRGIDPRKLVLGIPFYGRSLADRRATTYLRIRDQYQPEPAVDEVAEIYFNGPQTVERKTKSALQAGAGGVMIWEIGQDTHDAASLLRTISQTAQAHQAR